MVEFPGGIRGMALNLNSDNVGVVIFGDDRASAKAIRSSARAPSSTCRSAWGFWAAWSTGSAIRSTAKARSNVERSAWM